MLAGHGQNFAVKYLRAEQADEIMLSWQELSRKSIEPAGLSSPELLLPILKHKGGAELLTISHGPDLLLALPFVNRGLFNANWQTPLSMGGSTHTAAALQDATLETFLRTQTKPFQFKAIPRDGAFHKSLQRTSTHYTVFESWQRAALNLQGTYENWLHNNFDQKRRKEFKRLRNRLSEQGDLQTKILGCGETTDTFVVDFLALENAGWKGKKGTAIANDPKLAQALREAAQALHHVGKLRFWSLKFNGKAIATLYAVVEGDQAWLGKIAYDESFAKYSPGALIILDCTESFFSEPQVKTVDSTAIQGHPLIDRIWRNRLAMISVFVAPASLSASKFKFIVILAKAKHKTRNLIRDFYYKLRGKKRS